MDIDFSLTIASLPAAGSVRHFGTAVFLCELLYLCAYVGDRFMYVCGTAMCIQCSFQPVRTQLSNCWAWEILQK